MAANKKTAVVIVDIDSEILFTDMYNDLKNMLENNTALYIRRVRSMSQLLEAQSQYRPKVLLFVTGAVSKNEQLQSILKSHLESGGLVMLCCLFSSFSRPDDMNNLYQILDLPWRSSEYHRTHHALTSNAQSIFSTIGISNLDRIISAKAVQLSGVPSSDKLYEVARNAVTQSLVFAPAVANQEITMAAMAKMNDRGGRIVYLGDVNAEDGVSKLIVALCLAKHHGAL